MNLTCILHHALDRVLIPELVNIVGEYVIFRGIAGESLDGHCGWVTRVVALSDQHLVSASQDKTVRVWDLITRTSIVLTGHTNMVNALTMLGNRVVSGSHDHTIRIWDLSSLSGLSDLSSLDPGTIMETCVILKGHTGPIEEVCAFPDAHLLKGHIISKSYDKTIRIWDLSSKTSYTLKDYPGSAASMIVLRDGRLFLGLWSGNIEVRDLVTNTINILSGHTRGVVSLVELYDGRLACGCSDGTIRMWDLTTGVFSMLESHTYPVKALSVLTDGRLVSGSGASVRIWNLPSSSAVVLTNRYTIRTIQALPDGGLVTVQNGNIIQLWV